MTASKRRTGAHGRQSEPTAEAMTRLRRVLGSAPPSSLSKLDAADITDLADALAESKTRHSAELASAIEDGLKHLPRLLRMPVKRILFR